MCIRDSLQRFLLEMGHGFCFEARQKRILIDEDYFFADLVFYHRILKCHVIVELKIDKFRHEYALSLIHIWYLPSCKRLPFVSCNLRYQ